MRLRGIIRFVNVSCLAVIVIAGLVIGSSQAWGRPKRENPGLHPTSNSTAELQNSVRRLNDWLRASSQQDAEGWRRYLFLNVLDAQSARGEQADIPTLLQIHNRFLQNVEGLDHPAFQDVQSALRNQIQLLSAGQVGDLLVATTVARGQYHQISIEELDRQRDQAIYQFELLMKYYRRHLPSRQRADLFFDLQLDEVVEFLNEIEFELAPEFSVGKMDSMLRDVQESLDDVIKKIDAIPIIIEPDNDNPQQPGQPGQPALGDSQIPDGFPGPTPDEGDKTLEELEQDRAQLQEQIRKLRAQRREILTADTPRLRERLRVYNQLRQFSLNFEAMNKTTLDPYFVSAKDAFERFFYTYRYGTSDNLQEELLVQLNALESSLLELQGLDPRSAAGRLGASLRWMENANQLPHLVAAIRARYSLPNVYVSVTSNLINQVASRPQSERQPVRENVLGRLIRGFANTNGNVSIDLQDDPNQVHASIHYQGTVDSQTYVQQGKLFVYANADGQLEGRRSLYANIGGLYANQPYVAANFSTNFQGTSSRLKLVNRIASGQFEKVRGQGEATTARKAEGILLEQFTEQTQQPIADGKTAIADAQTRLAENSHWVPELYVRSLPDQILAIGKKATISTLAAQNFPVQYSIQTDLSVRLHDTMLSNYLDSTFSGKTFTNEELSAELTSLTGEEPTALTEDPDDGDNIEDESFSITFADVRPIQFEFENNGFRVVVSGTRFSQADRRIDAGLTITMRFKIKRIGNQLKFVRDGKAELDYIPGEIKTPRAVAFRSFLEGRLNPKDGGEQISVDLPENLIPIDQLEQLKDGKIINGLRLVQCRSENGWLYLGWNYAAPNTYPVWQYDLPAIWNEMVIDQLEHKYIDESQPATVNVQGE